MKCDCFCCYKKYICIFMCCSCSCIRIYPMRKRKKRKVKKVQWDKVKIKKYVISNNHHLDPVYP